ncbi:TIGR01458 family HAD-type hydrolase [Methylocaldum szegediense]|uniref:Haloacid dehalogenase-like hydrolase domain-containing protein 2 n=1 Tax=Methylocaldum szegediense TaxID=73780 RepID=A0ABN8X8C5_9GAMM|nr:TIGR01458 family HAD-type hydrolase [Methylocaldum szegediense]CAI8898146.1 phospholysine phosphohistidine inorganic pyrophosphate phosphatase [Methylocaldum szegediense]
MNSVCGSSNPISNIKGILFDLDGVLYIGSRVIEGAPETVKRIRATGYRLRVITNTSTQSLASLHDKLLQLGFDIDHAEILSAPQVVLRYLKRSGSPPCALLLDDDVKRDFAEIRDVQIEQANCIVLGDIGESWSYGLLNRIFNRLMQGATLVAVHKNRFWQTEEGLKMDIGGFVTALEYCSGIQATVMGKPSPDFFRIALQDMGLRPDETAIVGDDIDSDIGGGQKAGLTGILVRTGKYRESYVNASPIRPDKIIDSVNDLPALLGL